MDHAIRQVWQAFANEKIACDALSRSQSTLFFGTVLCEIDLGFLTADFI
jgi:hypothetical protein